MNTVRVLTTDYGDFPVPPDMIEAAKGVKWRKHDAGWPDMRTAAGKRWVEGFIRFTNQKRDEYERAVK